MSRPVRGLLAIAVCSLGYSAAAQTPADTSSNAVAVVTRASAALTTKSSEATPAATRVYTIGANDLLRIELKDVPGVPRMVRVQADGSIGYPLAGANVAVKGKTVAEAEASIAEAVRSLSKGGVIIKIAEYSSHTVNILGLVGDPGAQQIQRDAVPFYVIRAMTSVDPRASAVRISRSASARIEQHELTDAKLDSLLIFPGDSIEFGYGAFSGNLN